MTKDEHCLIPERHLVALETICLVFHPQQQGGLDALPDLEPVSPDQNKHRRGHGVGSPSGAGLLAVCVCYCHTRRMMQERAHTRCGQWLQFLNSPPQRERLFSARVVQNARWKPSAVNAPRHHWGRHITPPEESHLLHSAVWWLQSLHCCLLPQPAGFLTCSCPSVSCCSLPALRLVCWKLR